MNNSDFSQEALQSEYRRAVDRRRRLMILAEDEALCYEILLRTLARCSGHVFVADFAGVSNIREASLLLAAATASSKRRLGSIDRWTLWKSAFDNLEARAMRGQVVLVIRNADGLAGTGDEVLTLVSLQNELHRLSAVPLFLTAGSRDFVVGHLSSGGVLRSSLDVLAVTSVTGSPPMASSPGRPRPLS